MNFLVEQVFELISTFIRYTPVCNDYNHGKKLYSINNIINLFFLFIHQNNIVKFERIKSFFLHHGKKS